MNMPLASKGLFVFAALTSLLGACSQAPADRQDAQEAANEKPAETPKALVAPERSADSRIARKSAVIGKRDISQDGTPACFVEFSYAGHAPETLIWEGEECARLNVTLMDPAELRELGKWKRLDDFAQKHVRELTDGKVLYVEGEFTASVYPVGTTGQSYEVSVAD